MSKPNRRPSNRPRPPFDENQRPPNHINAFVNLNGVPYLVGEYLDRTQMRQMDRGHIGQTHVRVDSTSEAMRAIIDVHVNDIPSRPMGNRTNLRHLVRATERQTRRLNHQFDVFRRGIIVQVNYRLENQRTGQPIRSMQERMRIWDRNFFVDINERDISDNAILVNFTNSLTSTINQFTHGSDRMTLRIISVELFYPCLLREAIRRPGSSSHIGPAQFNDMLPFMEHGEWDHHRTFQNRQVVGDVMGDCDCDGFSGGAGMFINPPNWAMFNRFYRFDNMGRDIVLHFSEIHDPMNRVRMIPCGVVTINRAFTINPGHRIIFRFSVWKNDVVVVNDTRTLARAIGAQHVGQPVRPPIPPKRPPHQWDVAALIKMLLAGKMMDKEQNAELRRLREMLEDLMAGQCPPGPPEPCCPDYPDCDCNEPPPCCDCYPDCDCGNHGPPPPPPPCCDCYPNCDCGCECEPPESMSNDLIYDIINQIFNT